jgi:hypothetical protein
VLESWRAVRRNRGAAGIDKVSIRMFQQNLDANLDRLMRGATASVESGLRGEVSRSFLWLPGGTKLP